MARPLKKIKLDREQVIFFASIGCTEAEIAEACGVHEETFKRRFAAIYRRGRSDGKIKLRKLQIQSAQKGNCQMQIWLGKQILHQAEKIDQTVDMKTKPLQVIVSSQEAQENLGAAIAEVETKAQ